MNIFNKLEKTYFIIPKMMQLIINLQYYTLHQIKFLFATKFFEISIGEYGEYNAYIVCMTFFTNVVFGSYSDRTGKHKKMLMLLICTTVVLFCGFFVIPPYALYFWGLMFVYQVFNMPKQPLNDKLILDYLKESIGGTLEGYGKHRAFGTVAYLFATYLAEALVKSYDKGKEVFHWHNLIYYTVFFAILSNLLLYFLNIPESPKYRGRTTGFVELLKNKEYAFFLFILFLNAVTRNAMTSYFSNFYISIIQVKPYDIPKNTPLILKKVISIFNNNYVSTITMAGTFFEIITMYYSQSIIRMFGYFKPLLVAQLISVLRVYLYYRVDKRMKHGYAYTCAVELLKGFYFGITQIAGFAIAVKLTPPNLMATSQMMYQGTFLALGAIASGTIFGRLFDGHLKNPEAGFDQKLESFKNLFLLTIYISIATILIYIVKYGFIDKILFSREKEEEKLSIYLENVLDSSDIEIDTDDTINEIDGIQIDKTITEDNDIIKA
ncbi:hypothetical protein A0H76_2833 [Hepatospora eriocheir]|uniref:Major facilitator superfamily associated domain-containing protein n=1 Tax=Hepatospora eriocheir TaxID=1081669 RepID=A0A1X0QLB2_9MICR|nr:hypothetical protein A0H76_2833 [Hepatospora eriocheir]